MTEMERAHILANLAGKILAQTEDEQGGTGMARIECLEIDEDDAIEPAVVQISTSERDDVTIRVDGWSVGLLFSASAALELAQAIIERQTRV